MIINAQLPSGCWGDCESDTGTYHCNPHTVAVSIIPLAQYIFFSTTSPGIPLRPLLSSSSSNMNNADIYSNNRNNNQYANNDIASTPQFPAPVLDEP